MNDKIEKLMEALKKAAAMSLGQMGIVSASDHTTLMGSDVGETIDIMVGKGLVKLVMVELPANADATMAIQSAAPLKDILSAATFSGVQAGILAWSMRLATGTSDDAAKAGISTVDLASGATFLLLPGYTHIDRGDPRTYPEAASIMALQTKRGTDLLNALAGDIRARWTTQSLQAAAEKVSGKKISTSVVHRFVAKLKDLGLVAGAGATGFCITADGAKRIEAAIPGFLGASDRVHCISLPKAPVGRPLEPRSKDDGTIDGPRNEFDDILG